MVMGVVCTNSDELYTKLRFVQNGVGAVPSPFDCFLAHRGLKTLHLRMEAAGRYALVGTCKCARISGTLALDLTLFVSFLYCYITYRNAYAIALFLESHKAVQKVIYPGLPSHPQYALVKRQQHGSGAMITFYCTGGREQAALFLQSVRTRCCWLLLTCYVSSV